MIHRGFLVFRRVWRDRGARGEEGGVGAIFSPLNSLQKMYPSIPPAPLPTDNYLLSFQQQQMLIKPTAPRVACGLGIWGGGGGGAGKGAGARGQGAKNSLMPGGHEGEAQPGR